MKTIKSMKLVFVVLVLVFMSLQSCGVKDNTLENQMYSDKDRIITSYNEYNLKLKDSLIRILDNPVLSDKNSRLLFLGKNWKTNLEKRLFKKYNINKMITTFEAKYGAKNYFKLKEDIRKNVKDYEINQIRY